LEGDMDMAVAIRSAAALSELYFMFLSVRD